MPRVLSIVLDIEIEEIEGYSPLEMANFVVDFLYGSATNGKIDIQVAEWKKE